MTMEIVYRDDVKDVMDALLLEMPGVTGGKAFGHPAYKINKKVFLFVVREGITIKLPESRVKELLEAHSDMSIFQPVEGTSWKSWVLIGYPDAQKLRDHIDLLEESFQYVMG